MRSNGIVHLILPASEIVKEHQPNESLLKIMGTTTKELIEMFLMEWSALKHIDQFPAFAQDGMGQRISFEVNARLLVMDIIFDAMERRVELGEAVPVTEEDRRAAEKVMMSVWTNLSEYIFDLLEEMRVTDLQISQLHFVRWIGDDFVVSFPRYITAITNQRDKELELERKHEQDRLEQLKSSSPFCNYRADRRDDSAS